MNIFRIFRAFTCVFSVIFSASVFAQGSLDLSEYEMVFNDEFDAPHPGTVVDPAKWSTRFYWGPYVPINEEEQVYVDILDINSAHSHNPFSVNNGVLTIEAIETSASAQAPQQPGRTDPLYDASPDLFYQDDYNPSGVGYLSGILTTAQSYNTTHGYFEARLKFPEGQGLWPAFWLLNNKYVENSPEIDIVEFLGHKTDTVYHTMHYVDSENGYAKVSTPTYETLGTDYTDDFHTYGLAWDPTSIRFYVDGNKVREIDSEDFAISAQSMYMILNLAVGGTWPGTPDASTVFPAKFEVDFVRAYERKSIPAITQQVLDNDYQLMFSDEFNGTNLNPDVWNSSYLWGPYLQINNEEQMYIDKFGMHANHSVNPFEVSSGTLKIKAEEIAPVDLPSEPELIDPIWQDYPAYNNQTNYLEPDGWTPSYSSGILTSYDSFNFVNGYVEARIKMPTGRGLWPAFKLLNGYYVGPSPEMDIVEARGEEPFRTHHSYHYQNSVGVLQSSTEAFDLAGTGIDGFHTYGFQWDSERMVWYVDGVPVRETTGAEVSTQLSYVLLNLAVGGDFVADVGNGVTPAELEVDWVRVWQLDEAEELPIIPEDTVSNVALAGTASQSSVGFGGVPGRANDGNNNGRYRDNSVTHTQAGQSQPWWQVELAERTDIERIVLLNRTDCCSNRLNDVHVFVSENPFGNRTLSELQNDASIWHQYLPGIQGAETELPVNATGRYVRVQLAGNEALSLAEVEVYGSTSTAPEPEPILVSNVAPTAAASQSSVGFGGVPGRANDGNSNGRYRDNSVTHTAPGQSQPWWQLALAERTDVERIVLFNRSDCCSNRLSDVHVFVSENPFGDRTLSELQNDTSIWHQHLPGIQGAETELPVNATGRYVRVQLAGNGVLSLAEVEVYGSTSTAPEPEPILVSNVAPTATASQSSVGFGGVPGRANDGNTSGRYSDSSVTHTAPRQPQPWWQVALAERTDVERVVLFNRTDNCCTNRLSDVHVFVSENPFGDRTLSELQNDASIWHQYLPGIQGAEIELPVNATGRYVRVQLAGNGVLSLAEVEIYGSN